MWTWRTFRCCCPATGRGAGRRPPGLPFGGGDCVVDLKDLSVLRAHFGATQGFASAEGDIEPDGGDGDVDLGDLAVLRSAFGTNCN